MDLQFDFVTESSNSEVIKSNHDDLLTLKVVGQKGRVPLRSLETQFDFEISKRSQDVANFINLVPCLVTKCYNISPYVLDDDVNNDVINPRYREIRRVGGSGEGLI